MCNFYRNLIAENGIKYTYVSFSFLESQTVISTWAQNMALFGVCDPTMYIKHMLKWDIKKQELTSECSLTSWKSQVREKCLQGGSEVPCFLQSEYSLY